MPQVRAIRRRPIFDEQVKGLALENAGVFCEKAEENPDKKSFKVMAGITASFKGVVQIAHDLDGLDIDRVFLLKCVLLVTRNEREMLNVAMKLGERKLVGDAAPLVEERQVALLLWLEIV